METIIAACEEADLLSLLNDHLNRPNNINKTTVFSHKKCWKTTTAANATNNNNNAVLHEDEAHHKRLTQKLGPIRKALAEFDASAYMKLKQCSMDEIDSKSLREVGNFARLNETTFVNTIHNQITPPSNGIRYLHVTEKAGHYSIGIFVFPPNAIIPLHNHPGMIVLSRLLYGSLKARTYDIIFHNNKNNNDNDHHDYDEQSLESKKSWIPNFVSRVLTSSLRSSSSSSSSPSVKGGDETQIENVNHLGTTKTIPKGFVHVYENDEKELISPQITELYPYKSNIHEFQAGPNGVAVLDVLVPPYDVDDERDCTFYRENHHYNVPDSVDDSHFKNAHFSGTSVSSCSNMANGMDCDKSIRRRVWLEPIEQPHWFHCISGNYSRFSA